MSSALAEIDAHAMHVAQTTGSFSDVGHLVLDISRLFLDSVHLILTF